MSPPGGLLHVPQGTRPLPAAAAAPGRSATPGALTPPSPPGYTGPGSAAAHPEQEEGRDTVARVLSLGRYLVLLAVLGSFLGSATVFVWGFAIMLRSVYELAAGGAEAGEALGARMIATVDSMLLAVVLYIFAVALYELFIGRVEVPGWLVIHNLDDLKVKLSSVIILMMAVAFVEHLVEWRNPAETLMFAAAVALVAGALVFYSMHVEGKRLKKKESAPSQASHRV